MEYIEVILGFLLTALLGFFGYVFKKLSSHAVSITKLEASMVTDGQVREIVKEEIQPILDSDRNIIEKLDLISAQVNTLTIKTAVLEAMEERENR